MQCNERLGEHWFPFMRAGSGGITYHIDEAWCVAFMKGLDAIPLTCRCGQVTVGTLRRDPVYGKSVTETVTGDPTPGLFKGTFPQGNEASAMAAEPQFRTTLAAELDVEITKVRRLSRHNAALREERATLRSTMDDLRQQLGMLQAKVDGDRLVQKEEVLVQEGQHSIRVGLQVIHTISNPDPERIRRLAEEVCKAAYLSSDDIRAVWLRSLAGCAEEEA